MNPHCTGCGKTIKKLSDLVLVEVGGTLKGAYHRGCNKQRRYEVSGSTNREPRSGSTYFSDLRK